MQVRRPLYLWRLAFQIIVALLALSPQLQAADTHTSSQIIATALEQHCSKCHGREEETEGDVDLHLLDLQALENNLALLPKLIEVIDLQEMPPEDEPPLDPKLRETLVTELKKILHESAARTAHARVPLRRMNRFQYNNAVIDLFDLKCIVFTLPERMMREHKQYFKPETGKMADVVTVGSRPLGKSQMIEPRLAGVAAFPQDLRAEHGFDNRADHLSLSPLLMEAFLKLGQSVTQSPDFVQKNIGIWETFFAEPKQAAEEPAEIRQRLEAFLTRAFRRPVDGPILDRYAAFVTRQIESGTPFTEAMRAAAAAAISSPRFLYLYDTSKQNDSAIAPFELASRLSFFLWGGIPDQELLDAASSGKLMEPETLSVQFDRMMKDKKLKRFCDSFPSQWLQLERIISSVPNRDRFPGFYYLKYRDSMHMMMEPLLLFETVLIENQPITQLIDSDFTYRSKLLNEAYQDLGTDDPKKGGNGVAGLKFQRVPVTDRRMGGVITNAAVMTMTSGPNRTKPITRGAWVAGVIFNNPPEPPPADVPPLEETPPKTKKHLTLRQRLALHRERSDCKGCHEQIDPLGFALENYDPIGVWRDKDEHGLDIDASGTLFREHEFRDVIEFKDALLVEKDRFARGLTGHLLSFALARELDASDEIALDSITKATAKDGYRIQTMLRQIILSEPFRK